MSRLIILLFLSTITTAQVCHRLYRKDQFSITEPDKIVPLNLLVENEYQPESCNGYEFYSKDTASQRVAVVLSYILSKQGINGLKKVSTSPGKFNLRVSSFTYAYRGDTVFTDGGVEIPTSDLKCTRLSNVYYQSAFPVTISALKKIRKPSSVEIMGREVTLMTKDIRPFLDINITENVGDGQGNIISLDGIDRVTFDELLKELQLAFNYRQVDPDKPIQIGKTFHYRGSIPLIHPAEIVFDTMYTHCEYSDYKCLGHCGTVEYLPYILRGPMPAGVFGYPCGGTKQKCPGDGMHPFFTKTLKLDNNGYDTSAFTINHDRVYKPFWFHTSGSSKACTHDYCPKRSRSCALEILKGRLAKCQTISSIAILRRQYKSSSAPPPHMNSLFEYSDIGKADPGYFGITQDFFKRVQVPGQWGGDFSLRYHRNATFEFDQCDKYGFSLIGITKKGIFYSNYSIKAMRRCLDGLPPENLHIGRIRRSVSLENGSHVGNTSLTCNNRYNYVCTVHLTCPKSIDTAQVSETVEVSTDGCVSNLKTYFGPYVWVAVVFASTAFTVGLGSLILLIKNRKVIKYC